MILADNTKYSSTADNLQDYLSLQSVADIKISELLDECGNDLLIYPHSFCQCEDDAGDQTLFSLQLHHKGDRCVKAVLETGNMVGFIGVNGCPVSIRSRFSENGKEDSFLHYMLGKVLCINVVDMLHGTADDQIMDFLLYLFLRLLDEALAQGLYKEYLRNEYNDVNVRGAIDIGRHLKSNIPFSGRIAYRTREFSHDNHVTELIRHTIEYIKSTEFGKALMENDSGTRAGVARIIAATPSYKRQEREKVIARNLKIERHPYYSRYTALQKLCLRILRHERIKYGAKDNRIYGILFDVSYLWEEYLATIMIKQKFLHPNNRKKDGRIYLAAKHRLPRYPDFYREDVVADAKYKRNITRDDIHQIIAYMYCLKGRAGVFIQPDDTSCGVDSYDLRGYGEDNGAVLQTYRYPVSQTADNYRQFVAEMKRSEEQLAAFLESL